MLWLTSKVNVFHLKLHEFFSRCAYLKYSLIITFEFLIQIRNNNSKHMNKQKMASLGHFTLKIDFTISSSNYIPHQITGAFRAFRVFMDTETGIHRHTHHTSTHNRVNVTQSSTSAGQWHLIHLWRITPFHQYGGKCTITCFFCRIIY